VLAPVDLYSGVVLALLPWGFSLGVYEPFLKSGHLGEVWVVEICCCRGWLSSSMVADVEVSHAITVELRKGAANIETGEKIKGEYVISALRQWRWRGY
jgi:hypothetical protein